MPKIEELKDKDLCKLVDNRWNSSESIWNIVKRVYFRNSQYYDIESSDDQSSDGKDQYEDFGHGDTSHSRIPEYTRNVPIKKSNTRANRIFIDAEAVINSLIARPPKPNFLPGRTTPESKDLAELQEKYFLRKYDDLNVKEVFRKGMRNLYLSRLVVLKPFWNKKTNDFDVKSLDPRRVRFGKKASNEVESEFAIEEIDDTLENVINRFPDKKEAILKKVGISEDQIAIQNPEETYKEAWIQDRLIIKFEDIILSRGRNPYWDWDGVMITKEEGLKLAKDETTPKERKEILGTARDAGRNAKNEDGSENTELEAHFFNHFDMPRKPYIFATVLSNLDRPIGRTDFISQAIPLQESLDRKKRQIDDNAQIINGMIKVDSGVMTKKDAQSLRWETSGIIWGKGVATGVTREMGQALPNFIMEDMKDSREEIDNVMAATSAFRGEREGSETKGGRLALVEQSFQRLNEMIQVVDYIAYELFNWQYHLAKTRYTEIHYTKTMGSDNALKIIELMQDDFEDGTEVRIIPGNTLPEDKKFKFELAQADVEKGVLAPLDYFKMGPYDNPAEIAKNSELYQLNPAKFVGITDQELAQFQPQPVAPPQGPPTQPAQ